MMFFTNLMIGNIYKAIRKFNKITQIDFVSTVSKFSSKIFLFDKEKSILQVYFSTLNEILEIIIKNSTNLKKVLVSIYKHLFEVIKRYIITKLKVPIFKRYNLIVYLCQNY